MAIHVPNHQPAMEQQDLKDLFRPEGPVLPRLQPAASHHWRVSVRVPVS